MQPNMAASDAHLLPVNIPKPVLCTCSPCTFIAGMNVLRIHARKATRALPGASLLRARHMLIKQDRIAIRISHHEMGGTFGGFVGFECGFDAA